MTAPSAEVAAERARIKAIVDLPEATGIPKAALALALAGATVEESRQVLATMADVMTPDEVAASINRAKR